MKNIFDKTTAQELIQRINALAPDLKPLWGKMSADQMLAHCNVTYEMCYENKHVKPNAFMRFMLKTMIKGMVVNEKPFKKLSPTSPAFIIKGTKNFEAEKTRLISFINKTVEIGGEAFNNKDSLSFGKLTTSEWNNMFYKHLDHHLNPFGV